MIDLTIAAKNARLQALADYIDAGTGTAAILVLSGDRPPVGSAYTGTLLVTVPLPVPCGIPAGGELMLNVPEWVNASGTGTASWARIVTADGLSVADMGVGLTGSGADVEINTLYVFAGGLFSLTAAILRE